MKGIFIAIIALALILFGWFYFGADLANGPTTEPQNNSTSTPQDVFMKGDEEWARHTDLPLNFSIEYRISPDGYVAVPLNLSNESQAVGGISFYDKEEYAEFIASSVAREGPPGITIEVFENTNTETAREWVENNPRSNYADGNEISEIGIGGLPAAMYVWSGLYEADAIVVATNDYVYMMSGTWIDATSALRDDFLEFANTFMTLDGVAHIPDLITIENPKIGQEISSPLELSGEARGFWFFEAAAPVVLVDWDGRIIAEHYISVAPHAEWMTEDYVPFEGTLEFEKPEFGEQGALIFKNSNASGLPENDESIEIPIRFK